VVAPSWGDAMREYRNKAGKTRVMPSHYDLPEDRDEWDTFGWCLACGSGFEDVEPDCRKAQCSDCGEHTVYGLAELALMGLIDNSEGDEP